MFCNFRNVQPESRFKMKLRDPHTFKMLTGIEPETNDPIWIKISDWRGILDHVAPESLSGAGQVVRRNNRPDRLNQGKSG